MTEETQEQAQVVGTQPQETTKVDTERSLSNIISFLNSLAMDVSFPSIERRRAITSAETCERILGGVRARRRAALKAELKQD